MKELIEKLTCDTDPQLKDATRDVIQTAISFYEAKKKFLEACNREPARPWAKEELAIDTGEEIVKFISMSAEPGKEVSEDFEEGLTLLKEHLLAG